MKEDIRIQGQLRAYLQWPLFMAVILMAANVVVGLMDLKAGIVMTGFTLFYAAVCGWLYLYKRKRLLGGFWNFLLSMPSFRSILRRIWLSPMRLQMKAVFCCG